MALGPGKYDAECTKARESTKAVAALLIIISGDRGNGFSCQFEGMSGLTVLADLPGILRETADQIEKSGGRS